MGCEVEGKGSDGKEKKMKRMSIVGKIKMVQYNTNLL